VDEKQACSASTDCPVGQYCAHAAGESRCWADGVAPVVSAVTSSCATAPCLRDGIVHVEATVTDDHEVLDASVTLDLSSSQAFPMTRSGAVWAADVPLRALPFEFFAHDVVPTVVARDGARNPSAGAAGAAVAVTRLKWTYNAGAPLTSPAVMGDGTAVMGVSAGTDQALAVSAAGTKAWSQTVGGTSFVTAAPAIGQHAIWVGSEDGTLYGVSLNGSTVLANVGVSVGGPIKGSVAVKAAAAKDTAFATCKQVDNTGWLGAATSTANQFNVTSAADGFTTGPVIAADERIHAPTATLANDATLRSFTLRDTPFGLVTSWTAAIGKGSTAPAAIDAIGGVIAPSEEATPQLKSTLPGITPTTSVVGDLSAISLDSVIVLANGDFVVGDESGAVHRFSAAGPAWTPAPTLGSAVRGPMALDNPTAPFIVPTNAGKVFALRDDGTTLWETTLPSATQLRAGNIYTPPSQPAGQTLSVAYFSSGNGRLYAVIVDGQLDAGAPWPKAFHDPRNTNHAGPQP
jgi:hypothetical protein